MRSTIWHRCPIGDDLTVQTNLIPIQLLGKEAAFRILKPLDPGFTPTGTPPANTPTDAPQDPTQTPS